MITSASKNHKEHNVAFFALVAVVVEAVDDGGTHPHRHLLTLMPLHVSCHQNKRRRGGEPLLSKSQSNDGNNNDDNDDDDEDAVFTSLSKNDDNRYVIFFAIVVEAVEQQR